MKMAPAANRSIEASVRRAAPLESPPHRRRPSMPDTLARSSDTAPKPADLPGFGLGLRHQHYQQIAEAPGRVDWFEALSDNYMVPGGRPLWWLDTLRRDYP